MQGNKVPFNTAPAPPRHVHNDPLTLVGFLCARQLEESFLQHCNGLGVRLLGSFHGLQQPQSSILLPEGLIFHGILGNSGVVLHLRDTEEWQTYVCTKVSLGMSQALGVVAAATTEESSVALVVTDRMSSLSGSAPLHLPPRRLGDKHKDTHGS